MVYRVYPRSPAANLPFAKCHYGLITCAPTQTAHERNWWSAWNAKQVLNEGGRTFAAFNMHMGLSGDIHI